MIVVQLGMFVFLQVKKLIVIESKKLRGNFQILEVI